MKKATILLCGPPVSAVGGGPTHIKNMLASPLKDRFTLIHFETGSRGTESPARDEGILEKVFRIVTSPLALASKILGAWPDVIHLNSGMDSKAFWRDAVYLIVCKAFGRKVLIQMHGGSLEELTASPAMRRLVRTVFSLSDALVVIANSQKRAFEKLGVAERLSIIPNCVDVTQYRGADERVHSGRVRRLAFMGRLVRPKGMFDAMEAVRLLRAEEDFRDIEFLMAGSGPAKDEIEHWIREHSMEGCVKLVGSIYGRDKVEFLREADVFVFPSYHLEGLPYAIIESLAAGTPVIASKVAGIPDIVVDRVHGILIDTKDPRQVVEAVRELARSRENLRAMSKNCSTWAAQELGLDRLAARFGKIYEGLRA